MSTRRSLLLILALTSLLVARTPPAHAQCGHFRRGDANADGTADLSDAVFTLLYSFSGGTTPTCMDAADTDDNDTIEITDAVYLLGYLFMGLPTPRAPGPIECGPEESADRLDCAEYDACGPPVELHDLSGFERFEYRQGPGLGFCPDETRVFEATILRQPEGSYRLELALVRRDDTNPGECLFEQQPFGCFVREPLPSRELTSAEADALRSVFSAVAIHPAPDAICQCIAIDPCIIGSFAWDGVVTSHFLCSSGYVSSSSVGPILALLESFRAGG